MSINESITVKDPKAAIEAQKLHQKNESESLADKRMIVEHDESLQSQNVENLEDVEGVKEKGDYKGRKDQADVDGPQQDSQETDEVYVDPRDSAGLPPAGKNVGSLHADDLSRHDND